MTLIALKKFMELGSEQCLRSFVTNAAEVSSPAIVTKARALTSHAKERVKRIGIVTR